MKRPTWKIFGHLETIHITGKNKVVLVCEEIGNPSKIGGNSQTTNNFSANELRNIANYLDSIEK